jgi:type IV pilus assembly protein PilC
MSSATLTFEYKVRDKAGQVQSGEIEGQSSAAVVKTLRERGLVPLAVEQKKSSALSMEIKIPGFSGKVKVRDIALFSRQFSTMVNSGLSLIRSLTVLVDQTVNPALKEIITEVKRDVEQGISLSAAMEKHPKAFNRLYVAMVRAGEIGGVLDETLNRLADMMEAAVALRSKVKAAMAYPVVVFSMVILITVGMIIFVVPMFENMYSEIGDGTAKLPLPTQILVGLSKILETWGLALLAGIGGSVFAFRRWTATDSGRMAWDAIKLRMPVFGKLIHKTAIARFSRTMSVLSRTGVPILQAIDIVSETAGNAVIGKALSDLKDSIREGESLSEPLARHDVFPPMVVQMMAVGEETGALDTMLAKVADFYEREVDDAVNALTSLIEPMLIITMGITVGGILISLYLPIFNVSSLLQ